MEANELRRRRWAHLQALRADLGLEPLTVGGPDVARVVLAPAGAAPGAIEVRGGATLAVTIGPERHRVEATLPAAARTALTEALGGLDLREMGGEMRTGDEGVLALGEIRRGGRLHRFTTWSPPAETPEHTYVAALVALLAHCPDDDAVGQLRAALAAQL